MDSKIKDKSVDLLFQVVLSLKTVEECHDFFEDLCAVPETKAVSQRLTTTRMLRSKCVYSGIVAKTGTSTATINRVSHSLNYDCGGYEIVSKRLEENGDMEQ